MWFINILVEQFIGHKMDSLLISHFMCSSKGISVSGEIRVQWHNSGCTWLCLSATLCAVAEQWKNHYSDINSVPPGRHYKGITEFLQTATYYNETLTAVDRNAIEDLKLCKTSGLDTLSAEHFRYASNRISVLLSLCFNRAQCYFRLRVDVFKSSDSKFR